MRNVDLARDYVRRAEIRLRAIDVLFESESWPDVVRECQEAVELALKGFLRAHGIEPPRIHDVSQVLVQEQERLPAAVRGDVAQLARLSKQLRRDRELAFYGTEDVTPSDFYTREDATEARDGLRFVLRVVTPNLSRLP
jgi:HEPN domain-containing protein